MSEPAPDVVATWRQLFGTDLFRPRDEMDKWTLPGTLRWQALEIRETVERLAAVLRSWVPVLRSTEAYSRQRPQPARRPHRRKHPAIRRQAAAR